MSGPTPAARRLRKRRARTAFALQRLTRRKIQLRFHASDSCGFHLPWDQGGKLTICPDVKRDPDVKPW